MYLILLDWILKINVNAIANAEVVCPEGKLKYLESSIPVGTLISL